MASPQSPSRLNYYSQDRDDVEWDGCSHSSALGSDRERAIRPLPKRQRLVDSEEGEPKVEERGTAAQGVAKRDRRDDDALEEAFPPVLALAPALEYRTLTDGYDDGTASNHPPRLRPPLFDSNELADSSKSSLDPSLSSDSPPTSPSSQHSLQLEEKVRGPDYFPVFGEAGDKIVRSLATASSFSPAGLFGGLGLAALHPSLAPPVERSGTADEDEEEEGRERIFSGERGHISLTVSIQGVEGGNNKKKRKIPGVNSRATNGEEDDRAFDVEEAPEPPMAAEKAKGERASDYGPDFVVNKGDYPLLLPALTEAWTNGLAYA